MFRYADVLLMLAEALHRGSGSDSEAMLHIDMVRERAAGPGDNGGSFRTSSVVMAEEGWTLQDLIWYERRAELACEATAGSIWCVQDGPTQASSWATATRGQLRP